ncbi:MAG: hypothetical protein ACE5IY_03465 [bacterium]
MMTNDKHALDYPARETEPLQEIRKSDLSIGDRVVLQTINTTYSIRVVKDDIYLVSGGWFDQNRLSPMKTTIVGCTWGGSAVKQDLVAACGLCVEFGNQVVTTPIQRICVIPSSVESQEPAKS